MPLVDKSIRRLEERMVKDVLMGRTSKRCGCVWWCVMDFVVALVGSPASLIIVGLILSGTGLWPLMFREKAPPESY